MSAVISAPIIRIIIVNFNAGDLLVRCIETLLSQTFSNFEVVIVDNASTDGSLEFASVDDPRFTVISLAQNMGFAAGNNRGAEGCRTPWIALLNPDAFPEPNWLEELSKAIERYPDVTMFGSTQIDANDENSLDGSGDAFFAGGFARRGNHGHSRDDLPNDGETFSPCASAAIYRTDVFRTVSGFDENFFCYYEDVDLAFRIRLMGGRCIQVRDAIVKHVGSAVSGRRSDFVRFHSARNLVWLIVKNVPAPLFWLILPAHIGLQLMILSWAVIRGHFNPTSRGLAAGLKEVPRVWQQRKKIQSDKIVPWTKIARAMTWNPFKLLRRQHDVRT